MALSAGRRALLSVPLAVNAGGNPHAVRRLVRRRTDARITYFLLRFFLARVTSQKTTPMIATTKMMKAGDRNELSPMGIS
jgi:hypothetical protein